MPSDVRGQVTVVSDDTDDVVKRVRMLTTKEVLVGIPSTTAERKPDPQDPQPPSNALIGYAMEFGIPDRNIPQRAWLVPGIESDRAKIVETLKVAGQQVLAGKSHNIEQQFNKVGLIAQAAVQKKITDGPFQPLAPLTIKARITKGRTGTKPLIDSGQLRQAVTYVVRTKGKT